MVRGDTVVGLSAGGEKRRRVGDSNGMKRTLRGIIITVETLALCNIYANASH